MEIVSSPGWRSDQCSCWQGTDCCHLALNQAALRQKNRKSFQKHKLGHPALERYDDPTASVCRNSSCGATIPPQPFDCTSSTPPHSSNIFISPRINCEPTRFVDTALVDIEHK
jgi:hypothetical protein